MKEPKCRSRLRQLTLALSSVVLTGMAHALTLETPAPVLALPGELATLAVTASADAGTGPAQPCEPAVLRYSVPPGWTAISGERELCVPDASVGLLAFQVPLGTPAGRYSLPLTLESGGKQLEATGTVQVGEVSDFALATPQGVQAYIGQGQVVGVTLTNLGNHTDTFSVSVLGGTLVSPAQLELKAGESRSIQVRVKTSLAANTATLELDVRSLSNPLLGLRRVVVLGTPKGAEASDELRRNRLTASLAVTGEYEVIEANHPWQVGLSTELYGSLSDSVALFSEYNLDFRSAGTQNDLLLLRLSGSNWDSQLTTSFLRGDAAFFQTYRTDPLNYLAGVGYRSADKGQFFAQAGLQNRNWQATLEHRFGGGLASFEDDLRLGYQNQWGNFSGGLGFEAQYRDQNTLPWSYTVDQQAGYGQSDVQVQEAYRYESRPDQHRLQFNAAFQPLEALTLNAAAGFSVSPEAFFYSLNALALYRFDGELSTSLGGGVTSLGSQVFWDVGYTPRFGWGTLALRNRLGVQDGLLFDTYRAGVETGLEDISLQASLQGDLAGLNNYAARAAYSPLEGAQLSSSFEADLRAGPRDQSDWRYTFKAAAGYQNLDFQLEGQYSLRWQGESSLSTWGASSAVRIAPELALRATYSQNDQGGQSLKLGADVNLRSSFTTPSGVEDLFGGSSIGRLETRVYADLNRNGKRDPNEPGLPLKLSVAGRDRATDASGLLSLELREGDYRVNLAPEVSAQYALASDLPPKVTVVRRATTPLELGVVQVVGVQGRIFVNQDETGVQSAQNPALARAGVRLFGEGGERRATTDDSGYFALNGLPPGRYRLELLDVSSVLPLEPLEYDLSTGESPPLLTLFAKPNPGERTASLRAEDLGLELLLPEQTVPQGATLRLQAQTSREADSVVLKLGQQEVTLSSEDRKNWQGQVTLPRDSAQVLMVGGVARVGQGVSEAQGLLTVSASLPLSDLRYGPKQALSGQVLELALTTYQNPKRVEAHFPNGQIVALMPKDAYLWTADARAEKTPGEYRFTVLLDGQELGEYSYTVLDITAKASVATVKP